MSSKSQHALRKAAVLISSLDRQSADALLDKMGEEQASQVRSAIMNLDPVSPEEQRKVLQEFLQKSGRVTEPASSGIELDDSLVQRFAQPQTTQTAQEFPTQAVDETSPFRFLHQAGGEAFVRFLQHEHPQTIAVVVSHLTPNQAAEVVTQLSSEQQAEVFRRVADLDEMDPEIISDIEQQLEDMLADTIRTQRRRTAGLAAVGAIINAVDGGSRRDVFSNLAQRDQVLFDQLNHLDTHRTQPSPKFSAPAPKIKNRLTARDERIATGPTPSPQPKPRPTIRENFPPVSPAKNGPTKNTVANQGPSPIPQDTTDKSEPRQELTFDEMTQLDYHSLSKVLQAADPKITLLALTGARKEFTDRIFKQLPAKQAAVLRKKMEQTGPLRLRDVEQAQQRLANIAARLAQQGLIKIPTTKRFAMAA